MCSDVKQANFIASDSVLRSSMFYICFDGKGPKTKICCVLCCAKKVVEYVAYCASRLGKIEQPAFCIMKTRGGFNMAEMDLVRSEAVMQDAEPLWT